MEIALDGTDKLTIRSLTPDSVTIGERVYTSPVIITPDKILEDWNGIDYEAPDVTCLEYFLSLQVKIVILATGSRHRPLPEPFMAWMAEHGISLETMSTSAACRTYNVLSGEGREVACGIQFQGGTHE